jgi:hypothetical protein
VHDFAGYADGLQQSEGVFEEDVLLVVVMRLTKRLAVGIFEEHDPWWLDPFGLLKSLIDDDGTDSLAFQFACDQSSGLIADWSSRPDDSRVHAVRDHPTCDFWSGFVKQRLDLIADDVAHESIGRLGQ